MLDSAEDIVNGIAGEVLAEVQAEKAKDAASDTASSNSSLRGWSVNVSSTSACRTKNSSSNSFTTGRPTRAQLRQ